VRVVLQRVSRGQVRIDGDPVGSIGIGYVVLAGFTEGDDEATLAWMADKIVGLRLFPDSEGKMNLDLDDVAGSLLVVSQFTLYGDARKGRRPSFIGAAPGPRWPSPCTSDSSSSCETRAPGRVESGEFGAMMDVELVNDGPVTLLLER
jgi:D-aminoacyl-tRNA deacylase